MNKKITTIILATALVCSLCACGTNTSGEQDQPDASEPSTEASVAEEAEDKDTPDETEPSEGSFHRDEHAIPGDDHHYDDHGEPEPTHDPADVDHNEPTAPDGKVPTRRDVTNDTGDTEGEDSSEVLEIVTDVYDENGRIVEPEETKPEPPRKEAKG